MMIYNMNMMIISATYNKNGIHTLGCVSLESGTSAFIYHGLSKEQRKTLTIDELIGKYALINFHKTYDNFGLVTTLIPYVSKLFL